MYPSSKLPPYETVDTGYFQGLILTVNSYRLGVAGFLDSNEMRATGILPNRGILDQKTAFQWVRHNIGGFSGDPTRITAIGQSAGGSKYYL